MRPNTVRVMPVVIILTLLTAHTANANVYQTWEWTSYGTDGSLGLGTMTLELGIAPDSHFGMPIGLVEFAWDVADYGYSVVDTELEFLLYDSIGTDFATTFTFSAFELHPYTVSIADDHSSIIRSGSQDPITYTHSEFTRVSSVPIPAAAWFMGTALVGLMGYSRKTKSQSVAA